MASHSGVFSDRESDSRAGRSPGSRIITGRNAPEGLIEAANLATEMELLKHPFRGGVKARAGIEF